jgi:hypothetical protein
MKDENKKEKYESETLMNMKFGGFTERATQVIDELSRGGYVYIMIDDDGCCGFSNIFVRTGSEPPGEWLRVYESGKSHLYVHPRFQNSLRDRVFYVDVVDRESDDSFSAETGLGKKLLLRTWAEEVVSKPKLKDQRI